MTRNPFSHFTVTLDRIQNKFVRSWVATGQSPLTSEVVTLTAEDEAILRTAARFDQSGGSLRKTEIESLGRVLFTILAGQVAVGNYKNMTPPIRLSINTQTPAISSLPWELAVDTTHRGERFLALDNDVSITRYLDVVPTSHKVIEGPLQLLYVGASPQQFADLNIEVQRKNLLDTIHAVAGKCVMVTVLDPPTTDALWHELHRHHYHILHFDGHGIVAPDGQGVLVLENEKRQPAFLTGGQLRATMGENPPFLVVLGACRTLTGDGQRVLSGVAEQVVLEGKVTASVAMQFAIANPVAGHFNNAFYQRLFTGTDLDIDRAVRVGRQAIHVFQPDVDEKNPAWAGPVLFLQQSATLPEWKPGHCEEEPPPPPNAPLPERFSATVANGAFVFELQEDDKAWHLRLTNRGTTDAHNLRLTLKPSAALVVPNTLLKVARIPVRHTRDVDNFILHTRGAEPWTLDIQVAWRNALTNQVNLTTIQFRFPNGSVSL